MEKNNVSLTSARIEFAEIINACFRYNDIVNVDCYDKHVLDLLKYFFYCRGSSRPGTDIALAKLVFIKTLTLSSGKNKKCWALVSSSLFIGHQHVISMTFIQFFSTLLFLYIFSLKFVIFRTGRDIYALDSCQSQQSLSGNNIKAVIV